MTYDQMANSLLMIERTEQLDGERHAALQDAVAALRRAAEVQRWAQNEYDDKAKDGDAEWDHCSCCAYGRFTKRHHPVCAKAHVRRLLDGEGGTTP